MTSANQTQAQQTCGFLLNLCIARHMARIYGQNQATAITRCARKVRNETRDSKLYELAKQYASDLLPRTRDGKRLTGDELKVNSVAQVEADLRELKII